MHLRPAKPGEAQCQKCGNYAPDGLLCPLCEEIRQRESAMIRAEGAYAGRAGWMPR
jgi:hypothetical protein